MSHPEATAQALAALRNGETFQWYLIPMLAVVVYIYFNELGKKNYAGVAAGLALYGVHWLYEIGNALVQHFSGHALWTVPTGSAYLLLVGVGAELSLMFSVAGLVLSKVLPPDPGRRILGVNNRLLFVVGNAALFAIVEIFLARTPAFVWVYPFWGALPVFLLVYIPFFWTAQLAFDGSPRRRVRLVGGLFTADALLFALFGGLLGWI